MRQLRLFREKIRELILGDSVYGQFFDKQKIIFIHTPKAAGTSISRVLYGADPWHYSAQELRWISPKKFDRYRKVSFVRNPFDRLVSTYFYALSWVKINPKTSIKFVADYSTFEEFIISGINAKLVENHYFFWSYSKYLGSTTKSNIDIEVGRFEDLEMDFKRLFPNFGPLPKENASPERMEFVDLYTDQMKEKVLRLYDDDFKNFGYDF